VQEIDDKQMKALFKSLETSKNPLTTLMSLPNHYYKGINNLHNMREMTLRYAAYLHFKESLDKNGGNVTDYTASKRAIIKGLKTNELKAYQLSSDLLGNYADVSAAGQWMRRTVIPFYSFLETNMKRYYRMLANPVKSMIDGESIGKNSGALLYRLAAMTAVTALMQLINRIINKEPDDKLPEDVKARPHLTLGQLGDNVIAFTRIGNIYELLEWVGADDLKIESAGEIPRAFIDKVWSAVTPFVKVPTELAFGITFYPETDNPRQIRDRYEYLADSLGLASVYKMATGKPSPNSLKDLVTGAVIYSYDYKTSAYWDTLDNKDQFKGGTNDSFEPTPKRNAAYYMKQAIRYGETDKAIRYMKDYFKEGGTGNGIVMSLAYMNPNYGFTSPDTIFKGQEWLDGMTDIEYDKYVTACNYYKEYLALDDGYAKAIRKADNERAMELLEQYIRQVTNKQKAGK
jgi:hypothetical protein